MIFLFSNYFGLLYFKLINAEKKRISLNIVGPTVLKTSAGASLGKIPEGNQFSVKQEMRLPSMWFFVLMIVLNVLACTRKHGLKRNCYSCSFLSTQVSWRTARTYF